MKKVLCGTDFSENGARAVTAAGAIARRTGGTVILAHATDEPETWPSPARKNGRFPDSQRKKLDQEVARLAGLGVSASGRLLRGPWADDALLDAALTEEADLVVVSATGKSVHGRFRLGSVSERIAEAAPRPTLVVHSAAPFESWAAETRPLRIFVAFDFKAVSDAALRWTRDFAAAGGCEIVVGHVHGPVSAGGRRSPDGMKYVSRSRRTLERDVTLRAESILGKDVARIRIAPASSRPDLPLIEMARKEQADLLVVGTHQRHGLGRIGHPSVSRGLLRLAGANLVCVPACAALPGPSLRPSRVLVATDLSGRGTSLIPYACGVVGPGGVVRLIHVVEPVRAPNPLIGGQLEQQTPTRGERRIMLAEIDRRLSALVPLDVAGRGVDVEVAVIESQKVPEAIRQEAERFGAELICIGSRSQGLGGAVLSPVANTLLRGRRPVLVVREPVP